VITVDLALQLVVNDQITTKHMRPYREDITSHVCASKHQSFFPYILFLAVAKETQGQTGVIPAPEAWILIALLILLTYKRHDLFLIPIGLTKH